MSWSDFFLPAGAQTTDEAHENYERQQEALRQQMERRRQEGTISQATREINDALLNTPLDDQDAAAWDGLSEGLAEGRDNIDRGVFGALAGFLGAVPRFVWVLAAVGLFLWLGGGTMLLRRGKGLLK